MLETVLDFCYAPLARVRIAAVLGHPHNLFLWRHCGSAVAYADCNKHAHSHDHSDTDTNPDSDPDIDPNADPEPFAHRHSDAGLLHAGGKVDVLRK